MLSLERKEKRMTQGRADRHEGGGGLLAKAFYMTQLGVWETKEKEVQNE